MTHDEVMLALGARQGRNGSWNREIPTGSVALTSPWEQAGWVVEQMAERGWEPAVAYVAEWNPPWSGCIVVQDQPLWFPADTAPAAIFAAAGEALSR